MKNNIKIVGLLIALVVNTAVYAQRTVSIRQFEAGKQAYRNSTNPLAAGLDDGEDITYVKDVDNELNKFIGVWTGFYANKNYEFTFVKHTAYKFKTTDDISFDLLMCMVTVKDNTNNVIYTNTNKPTGLKGFTGENFQMNTDVYNLNFTGNCYNESGTVFIYLNALGKMSLSFAISPDLKSNDCPNGFTPVLPLVPDHVLLTKQP